MVQIIFCSVRGSRLLLEDQNTDCTLIPNPIDLRGWVSCTQFQQNSFTSGHVFVDQIYIRLITGIIYYIFRPGMSNAQISSQILSLDSIKACHHTVVWPWPNMYQSDNRIQSQIQRLHLITKLFSPNLINAQNSPKIFAILEIDEIDINVCMKPTFYL